MNKNLHRIVFNQARGMLIATAESAASHSRGDGRGRRPASQPNPPTQRFRLAPGALALLMTLSSTLGAINTAYAQIVTDPTAPQNQRPTVTTATNGVPLINIQTPSAGGVSRNTYSQFDVQQNGVILNNARTNAQTQLGGWIQGNANLAGGTARIILNEVNSTNPSLLRGYVEVGGDRAQVVIANPAGVTCDGCGFINVTRGTLTTGTPIINGGNLDGFRVERGQIIVQGSGLDATQADYTDLIARSVQINAGLWANQLKVTAGANQVSTDNSQVSRIAGGGSTPALAIDVAQLGGMYAGKITLIGTEAGVGVRNAGQIGASAGDVAITVDGQLTNRGTLTALGNVSLNASQLDNRNAKIQATGNIDATLGSGQLDNSGGLLRANQALSVSAGTITNSGTQGTDQGLEGQSVTLNAAQIANDDGAIRADLGITLTSGGALDNSRGLIAGQTLQILDPNRAIAASKTLAITNTGGTLYASQNLGIDSASLTGDGNLYALNDLSLSLNSAFANTGQIIANHDATLFTTGLLGNSGSLKAGNALSVAAANLDNAANGEISALTTRIDVTSTVNNRGLIDGSTTAITGGTVNNLGSGSIYGDTLSIAAGTLNNSNESGTSPVIAARSRLDLGVTTLNNDNGALIFSSGDLLIGGSLDGNRQASGRAGTLTNNGGTIQALGGLAITADTLVNSNANFSAVAVASGSPVNRTVYYTSRGTFLEEQIAAKYDSGVWGNLLSNYGTPNQWANSTISFDLNPTVANPNGGTGGNTGALTVYNYVVESYQPLAALVQSSAPGQLISGGNMTLDVSTTLTNDKSRIVAGGALSIVGQSINNIAAQITATEYHAGTNYSWRYAGHDGKSTGHHCDCDTYAFVAGGYADAVGVTLDASITAALDHQTTGSGSAIPTRANASAGQIVTPAIPNNSLYHVLPAANSHVLVETDPRFANYRTWLSSDYMQQQLGLDPTVAQKRLGDGFYEQQLIREQIGQLTGQRFLTGYASDEAQYQGLMNAAVTQARAFNLHLGVALTAAQVAQLTSDIVWLVEQSVTLPDGSTQKVLVPQVYLLPRSGDLKADGTLIAGQTVSIRAGGDISNSGTVAGRTLLDLSAANVQNLGGRLTGKAVQIAASNDINNLGGRIEAEDSLALSAGRDINLETTTVTGSGQTEQGHFSRTQIDRVAGLYVTGSSGSLSAVAGRNMTLTAAEVVNAGSGTTTLAAGNDLTLATVTTRDVIDIGGNSRNHVQVNASSEVGSRLRTQGDATLIAGNDLLGRAVDLQAQGNLALTAGNDVVLAAGRNEQTIDIASYSSGRSGGGLMGGKKVTRSLEIKAETSTAQEGTLSGKNFSIQAKQDIALEGGQYTAQEKLALDAGRDLLIAAASDSLQGSQNLSSKNGAKVKQQSEQLSSNTTTGAILVAGSDLSLKSTRDTTLVASALAAGNTVAIQSGGDLNLQAAQSDRQVQSTDYDQGKKKAVTHTREEAETRQLLSTITAGSGLDISVGGNFSAEVGEKNADGSLKADRMTATGIERGDSRQQVSITGTGSGGSSLAESAKKALASGIRADANDAFTAGATASGAAALSQYLQSGLVQIKQDQQLASKIQQVLDSSAGTTLTVKDDAGHVSLTVAGQAKVQEVYNTLKLSENFDVKKFADQGTAQIVTLVAAIVITIYTGGAGAATLGGMLAGGAGTTAAVINAAIIGMSSTMIGQLAGGASFDKAFQAGLKAGATSALMAGVAAGVSSMVNGTAASGTANTANTTTSIDSGSQNLQLGNSGVSTTASSVSKLDTLMSANYWQQTGLNALAKGVLTKAQGGKFEDGLIGSVVGSLAANGAGIIGEMTQGNALANIVSHAVLGCAVAAASKQDCGSGALGGAASASLARVIDSSLGKDNLSDGDPNDPNRKAIIAAGAVTGSMVIAAATGKDVLTTGNAAANEVTNNYLTHRQIQDKKSELAEAKTDDQRKQVEQKYAVIDKQQQAVAADCLLSGNCSSVTMNTETIKGVLADLNASCAAPRICSPEAVSSISQLNGLLAKVDAVTPVYSVEEFLLTNKLLSTAIKAVPAVLEKLAANIGANGVDAAAAGSLISETNSIARNGSRLVLDQRYVSDVGNVACGPTACAMVLNDGGKWVNVTQIAREAGLVPGVGTDVVGLSKTLQNNGLSSATWTLEASVDDLAVATSKGNAAIARVTLKNGEGHFVVVDGVTVRQGQSVVAIRDPGTGKQYFVPSQEFAKKFSGQVVLTR